MKIFISGDWQLDCQPAYDQMNPETNRSTRFDENVEIIEGVIDAALAAGAEGMIHLGDLTENRNPKSLELEAAAHLFARFMHDGGQVWGVAGNHDGAFFDVSSSSFAPLAAMRAEQFTLFHKVTYEPAIRMLAIPYIHRATPAEIQSMVEAAHGSEDGPLPGLAFAAIHYGLQGCTVGARNLVLPGDYLGPDQLKAFPLDHVFAGHIHKAQELPFGGARGWHPGSPVICDMGEREDRKTYILFDTVTREVTVREIPQRRRWVTVPYSADIATKPAGWGPEDLVKISGTYDKPDYPKATIEEAFKAGIPRPFALEIEVKPVKAERALRSLSVTSAGGLREALQAYVREKFHRFSDTPGHIGPATEAALAALQEQGALTLCAEVVPTNIKITNFMTFLGYEGDFLNGSPMLVAGENGVGKTNFFEAILWVITGKTSKGLDLSGVVRQGVQDAEVVMELVGMSAEQEDQRFRISRAVKLSKAGKATAKLTLERWNTLAQAWDKTMSDGTQAEIQGRIDGLVGGSYLTLRTTNFKFQNDMSPFIRCHPAERKAVIGEVTGLAPLNRAFKVLDARRLESARALQAGKDRLAGMIAAGEGNEEQLADLKQEAIAAVAEVTAAREELPTGEILESAAREAYTQAKAKVQTLESQLHGQPNTEAKLLAATQAHTTYEQTYQSGRAEKVRQHGDLKAQITTAEAELAIAQVPATEVILDTELRYKGAMGHQEQLRAEREQAKTALATTEAQKASLESTVKSTTTDLLKAETALAGLGTLPSEEEALAAKATAEVESAQAVEACTLAMQEAMKAREAKKTLEDKGKAYIEEKRAFEGKDVGACTRCGQAIDSSHIEKEIARIDAEAAENVTAILVAAEESKKADAALVAASGAKSIAQEKAKAAGEAFHSLQLRIHTHKTLNTNMAGLREKLAADQADLAVKVGEWEAADKALKAADAILNDATIVLKQLATEYEALRMVVQKVESTRGRLQALQVQMTALTEAGIREKAEYDAEVVRLKAAMEEARATHESQTVLTTLLREQVQVARGEVESVNNSLTTAVVALQAIRSKIAAAEQRAQGITGNITRLESQQGALVQARFELGLLKERAEIDEIAAKLLDARDGLPVYLIDQALPFLEDRINHYLGKLGMERLLVQLTTLSEDKETLAVLIDNGRPGPRLDVAAFSGGQLDRIEYGMKCALADLARQTRGVTFGLVCFDEPSGGLNAAGKEALINLLYDRCEAYPVTILTSHDEALIRAFHNQIRFGQGPAEETIVVGRARLPNSNALEIKEDLLTAAA